MGGEGLARATEIAILNANYIATKLDPHFPVLYRNAKGRVAHECIVDPRPLKASCGVTVDDIAKRLIDYGFHAPTMSFPVPGTLMIEPTESESKAELDRFCDAMIAIRREIAEIESGRWKVEASPLRHAPHTVHDIADEAWARAEMRSYLGLEKGRLTIGMIQTSASGVDVAGAVAEFSQRYPGIELHIVDQTTAEMVEGVRRGPLDLAIVGIGPAELPDGLESRQLAVEPLVGVVSEKLADGLVGPVSIADLLGRGRLIQFAAGTGIRRHVDAALRRAGLEASSPLELNQASDLVVFAALGLGVTIVPRTLAVTSAPQLAEAGRRCVVLGLTDPLAVHPVTVVFAPSRLSASAQEFFDLLIRVANNKKKRSLSADTCVGPIEHLIPDLSV